MVAKKAGDVLLGVEVLKPVFQGTKYHAPGEHFECPREVAERLAALGKVKVVAGAQWVAKMGVAPAAVPVVDAEGPMVRIRSRVDNRLVGSTLMQLGQEVEVREREAVGLLLSNRVELVGELSPRGQDFMRKMGTVHGHGVHDLAGFAY